MNNENVGEILQSEMPIEVEGEVQARSEKRMHQLKKELRRIEEEFDSAREQWRNDRRALVLEIEQLEEAVDHAVEAARRQLSEDLHSELRFQIDELTRSREQLQEDLASDRQKYEADRNNLKAQITAMEGSFIDAVQRSNNPARQVMSVRDQIDARLSEAKQEWQLEWSAERRRLLAEIERLKKTGLPVDDKKEAARRAVLEKLGKVPASASASSFNATNSDPSFEQGKKEWDGERDRLNSRIKQLEAELQNAKDALRGEIAQEVRTQFESQLAETNRERQRLEEEVQSVSSELAEARERFTGRIKALEDALPEAQDAARRQAVAELESEYTAKIDEAARMRSRIERKHQDAIEEYEDQLRSSKKRIAGLEEALKEMNRVPANSITSD